MNEQHIRRLQNIESWSDFIEERNSMKNIVDSNLEVLKHEELRRSTKSEHFKL